MRNEDQLFIDSYAVTPVGPHTTEERLAVGAGQLIDVANNVGAVCKNVSFNVRNGTVIDPLLGVALANEGFTLSENPATCRSAAEGSDLMDPRVFEALRERVCSGKTGYRGFSGVSIRPVKTMEEEVMAGVTKSDELKMLNVELLEGVEFNAEDTVAHYQVSLSENTSMQKLGASELVATELARALIDKQRSPHRSLPTWTIIKFFEPRNLVAPFPASFLFDSNGKIERMAVISDDNHAVSVLLTSKLNGAMDFFRRIKEDEEGMPENRYLGHGFLMLSQFLDSGGNQCANQFDRVKQYGLALVAEMNERYPDFWDSGPIDPRLRNNVY